MNQPRSPPSEPEILGDFLGDLGEILASLQPFDHCAGVIVGCDENVTRVDFGFGLLRFGGFVIGRLQRRIG